MSCHGNGDSDFPGPVFCCNLIHVASRILMSVPRGSNPCEVRSKTHERGEETLWSHYKKLFKSFERLIYNSNNNLLHLYSAFLDTQRALHCKGAISSSTTNVQHPPGWCDGSHSAPERSPHTSLLVERRQSDEANQCLGMIRRPWWSEASGLVWPGCQGNTPTLFRRTSWDF